jgi:hypothetical protein
MNIGFEKTFETVVRPSNLYTAAIVFLLLTALMVIATYSILYRKKKNNQLNNTVRQQLGTLITELFVYENLAKIEIPDSLFDWLKHKDARQMVIDELVGNKNSFVGSISENLKNLYTVLGLNIDSRIKLDDKRPYMQCQGIHELCVMEQKDQYRKVLQLTNSRNYDVRIEAQTAILKWYGFKGLRFLNVASYPISEFQQLKMLELLRPLSFTGFKNLDKWLASKNDTVVNFALKLAEHYNQAQVKGEVAACLTHSNEAVRVQAVKTLAVIGDELTAKLLTTAYENERFTNRLNILRELPKVAGDEQQVFLIEQLNEGHEYLKLAAAKVLAACTSGGIEILEAKMQVEPIPFRDIYLHVKSLATK